MSIDVLAGWASTTRDLVLFYSLPFVAYALVASRVGFLGKLAAAASYALLAGGAVGLLAPNSEFVVAAALGWCYLAVATLVVHGLQWTRRWWRPPNLLTFSACALLYTVGPSWLLPLPVPFLLMAGWEMMFSSYSYCLEAGRGAQVASPRRALFFVLVNPTLVYPLSGRDLGAAAFGWRGVGRLLLGVLAMTSQVALLSVLSRLGVSPSFELHVGYLHSAVGLLAILFGFYLGHSGLASFQIGTLRLLGYELPERYHYPFLAVGPLDVWRRWNTYLGLWLHRYVFLPLALRWRRTLRHAPSELSKGLAVFATFLVCGLLHEHAGLIERHQLPVGALLGFTFFGLATMLWLAGGRLVRSALARSRALGRAIPRPLRAFAAFSLQIQIVLVFGWLTLPALAGMGLPSFFLALLGR